MWDRHPAGLAQRIGGAASPAAVALSPPPRGFPEADLGQSLPNSEQLGHNPRAQASRSCPISQGVLQGLPCAGEWP